MMSKIEEHLDYPLSFETRGAFRLEDWLCHIFDTQKNRGHNSGTRWSWISIWGEIFWRWLLIDLKNRRFWRKIMVCNQFTCCQEKMWAQPGCSFFLHLFSFTDIFLCFKVTGSWPRTPRITAVSLHQVLVSKLPLHLGFRWREYEMNASSLGVWWWANLLKAYHFFPKRFSKWTTRWWLRQVLDSFLKGANLHFLFLISRQQVVRVWEIWVPQGNYTVTKLFPAGKMT